jgi:quinoprotein glucose dehydrogenase
MSQYVVGPLFQPPIVRDSKGKIATLMLPRATGGANWPGGALDPETGILYVASVTDPSGMALSPPDPKRSDMAYVGGRGFGGEGPGGSGGPGGPGGSDGPGFGGFGGGRMRESSMGPQGLPLVKPPWGRITAIDLNKGEHVWMIANGDAPDYVKNHPAMKGIDLSNAGKPEKSHILVTKTLVFAAEGAGLFNGGVSSGDNSFRAIDKLTGKIIHEMELPASSTGIPMTYLANDRQYIVIAVGAMGHPGELVAYTLP